jgi:predicted transcriptional regulator
MTEKKKEQRRGQQSGKRKKTEIIIELIKEGPRNEQTGFKITKLKGGGIAQRGLGRALGGKV